MAISIADTSFLFSLYGNDARTASAKAWVQRKNQPTTITALSRYELGHAMRFAAFRKVISPTDALASLAAFEADLQAGYLQLAPCDFSVIVEEARRLSDRHTLAGGHRSFDILHVATARVVKATAFLTFDANQRKLAGAVGLTVAP
ncbi:MAG TPA: type II toxin-antitoxin system VapC family toxin [Opitutaceae bacterium]|jgi:predicted nucleic acid-binding protein|nr:type II toxin-antitoxin system VapC family toxin [Opitutaceae bacterium]